MPEGHLHAVVDAIAAAGSKQLARRAAEGAPVPFDLVEVPSSGTGAPLFSYRPRTRDFVEEHIGSLRGLMAWGTAVNVLAGFDGLGDYLLTHGERHVPIDARERADLVLRVLLARMHEETGDFLHTPARSAEASAELARCLLAGRVEGTVVVPLLGVRLDEERVPIENGLELVRDDVVADLPREARSPVRSRPGTVIVVRSLEDPARAAALAQARPRLRALLTALRLYDQPAPALAPVAWSRMRGDGWASHPFIGTCARASGTLHIRAEDHEAIRGFCALMAGKPSAQGPAVWALRRFELACERAEHGEALTDVLLGLRALLESDHVGSGALADRLAALCAAPGEWEALRGRVQIAESLEVALMQGSATDPSRTRALALELRGHLRALLRDMACGHLPDDLVEIAEHHLVHDEHGRPLLAAQPAPEPTVVAQAPAPAVAYEPVPEPVAHAPEVVAHAPEPAVVEQDLSFEAHPVVVTDVREDPLDDLFIEVDGEFDDVFAAPADLEPVALAPRTPPAAPGAPSPQATLAAPQRSPAPAPAPMTAPQSAPPAPDTPQATHGAAKRLPALPMQRFARKARAQVVGPQPASVPAPPTVPVVDQTAAPAATPEPQPAPARRRRVSPPPVRPELVVTPGPGYQVQTEREHAPEPLSPPLQAGRPAPVDRERTDSGESFEAAFIRSLSEGPGSLR